MSFLATVPLIVSEHSIERFIQRVGGCTFDQACKGISEDIRHGTVISLKRTKEIVKSWGLPRTPGRTLSTFIVSVDERRIYICRWSKARLVVKTVICDTINQEA